MEDLPQKLEELQGYYAESLQRIHVLNKIISQYSQTTGIDPFDMLLPTNSEEVIKFPCKIGIGPSKLGGRGVFAMEDIEEGEVVEVSPVIICLRSTVDNSPLIDYYFPVDDEGGLFCAIVLGWGSIYNHSDNPSIHWILNTAKREVAFLANRRIATGEELTHNYGAAYWNCASRAGSKK